MDHRYQKRKITLEHLLIFIAGFSFGEAVNAVAAWARGEELAIVANNDRKATFMPLVSAFLVRGQVPYLDTDYRR